MERDGERQREVDLLIHSDSYIHTYSYVNRVPKCKEIEDHVARNKSGVYQLLNIRPRPLFSSAA